MLRNYFKIAFRHLWRTRLYAFINIAGLTVGIVCMLFAVFYVTDERSFDQFHAKNPNLYRITSTRTENGKKVITGGTGQVQGAAFKAQVPEITEFTRLMGGDILGDLRSGDRAFRLQTLFVDQSFLKVFTFKLKKGEIQNALSNVNSVVITERTALKFFNRLDVIGQPLQMDADPSALRLGKPLVVSGVIENPPANSSIQFDVLLPFSFMQLSFDDTSWNSLYLGTFVTLHPGADLDAVVDKINRIALVHSKQQSNTENAEYTSGISYGLQKITDIHLNPMEVSDSNREGGVINGSDPVYSYLFLGIAAFILLMASINFINISVANSMKRAREVGVRKVTGSTQFQILFQFIGESVILCLIAFISAGLVTHQLLPMFNQLSGKQIILSSLFSFELSCWLPVLFFVNILTAAVYPAYLLSNLNPVKVLYRQGNLSGNNIFGKSLIIFQFSVSVILGISTWVFYEQMRLIRTKDLGYKPEQVVKIGVPGITDIKNIGQRFQNELKNNAVITDISYAGEFGFRDAKVNDRHFQSNYRTVDEDYLPVMSMKIKEGRNLSARFQADKKYGVLVNEAFVEAAGISNPIGLDFYADEYFTKEPLKIVGVVSNFHFESLREGIRPMIMLSSEQYGGHSIFAKTQFRNQEKSLTELKTAFRKLFPGAVFDYVFLDEQNAQEYQMELRWQKIISYAAVLSIFICVIGLFSLAHLSTTQRTRETGIRLVLGATVSNIVLLFSKDFLKMMSVAVLIASPVAYFIMGRWLADFAYRIDISWWMFAGVAGIAFIITLLTVGSQAVKAAMLDPVKAFYTGND